MANFDCFKIWLSPFILILVPPRWIVEPVDSSVEEGGEVTVHCKADGHPKPKITWKKSQGKSSIFQMRKSSQNDISTIK